MEAVVKQAVVRLLTDVQQTTNTILRGPRTWVSRIVCAIVSIIFFAVLLYIRLHLASAFTSPIPPIPPMETPTATSPESTNSIFDKLWDFAKEYRATTITIAVIFSITVLLLALGGFKLVVRGFKLVEKAVEVVVHGFLDFFPRIIRELRATRATATRHHHDDTEAQAQAEHEVDSTTDSTATATTPNRWQKLTCGLFIRRSRHASQDTAATPLRHLNNPPRQQNSLSGPGTPGTTTTPEPHSNDSGTPVVPAGLASTSSSRAVTTEESVFQYTARGRITEA
jgi:hypothetical protein